MYRIGDFFFIIFIICLAKTALAYVRITQDGPGTLDSTISLRAQLYDDGTGRKLGTDNLYKFEWRDNAFPQHTYSEQGDFSTSLWNVTYKSHTYSPGQYEIEVRVKRWVSFFFWDIGSERIVVNITALLNGEMEFVQNKTILGGNYVSSAQEVVHRVALNGPDSKLLSGNNTVVNTYWFVGCTYYGSTPDLSFSYNYTKEDLDQTRTIGALVVAGKETTVTTENSLMNSTDTNTTESFDTTFNPDGNCEDFPVVPKDPNKYYGYFKRHIIPTAPVKIDSINGSTWLKTGEMLQLNVMCSGSSPFYHCVRFISGEYNITGNETCSQARQTQSCRVSVTRLLNHETKYTVLFVVGNRVSKTVTPVGVTRYKEKHHPQLSVIIVPISCTAIALVLVIFGVAYYIQSRNRYRIEVADFDFSRNSDTEYKTFKERLRDAVSSAFTRVKDDEYSEEGPSHYSGGGGVWSPTRKYGSMQ